MVVFILGILSAAVVVNVVGLVGRGEREAYATDSRTIQLAVSTFYTDIHAYSSDGGWNEAGNYTSVHNFPTGNATSDPYLYLGNVVTLDGLEVSEMWSAPGVQASELDIIRSAIWMGLLTNGPGDGDVAGAGPDVPTGYNNSPLAGEHGPYLNPLPKSCSDKNQATMATGSYTWIVGAQGSVYGVFPYDTDEDGINEWCAGFGGWYP